MSRKVLFILIAVFALAGHAQSKQVINILFLGKTQNGKSSLVNIFYNHIMGKKYEDERDIVIPLRDGADELLVNVDAYKAYQVELRGLSESQTIEVHRYTARNDRYVVHLWDAPGFNDSQEKIIDEEIVQRIAGAVRQAAFNMIAVVLRPNEAATFDMKANIDRIQTMLPKSAAKNIVGIYTRATQLSKGMRAANAQVFETLLGRTQADTKPLVYNLDGSSFFDEDAADGHIRWMADDRVINNILDDAALLEPFEAAEVLEIQNIINDMRINFKRRHILSNLFVEANSAIEQLEVDRSAAEERRIANQDYEKEKTVTIEKKEKVRCRLVRLFSPPVCDTRTTSHTGITKYTDEEQKERFLKALADIEIKTETIQAIENQKIIWTGQLEHLLKDLQMLQKERKALSLSTKVDSFILYLNHQIHAAKNAPNYDERQRKVRLDSLESQKLFYEHLRDL